MSCDFCRFFDFSSARADVDKQFNHASIRFAGGWSRFPLDQQFKYCPVCGEPRNSSALHRWVHLGGDEWCCSCCGEVEHTEGSWEKPDLKYCYECGAKMEIEEEV